MTPRTTTGIVLRRFNTTGRYELEQPGLPVRRFGAEQTLESVQIHANIHGGYWLRGTAEVQPPATVWTWVQL